MARSRQNFLTGTVDDSPLLTGATLLTSTGLDDMNTIANPTTAVIVLDPQRVHGAQEIVFVTAHTSGQRTATVLRGQLGTTQRDHPTGTVWVQPMLVDDPAFLDQANTFSATNTFSSDILANAGIDVKGTITPAAYISGEIRFPDTTNVINGNGMGISTLATGSPRFYFDHRGTSNTGDFVWRNGTGGATTIMSLSSGGLLNASGGVDSSGSPSGFNGGEFRFNVSTSSVGAGISTVAPGAPTLAFNHRGASNTGSFNWSNGTNGATTLMTLSGTGVLTVAGGVVQASAGDLSLKASGTSSLFLIPAPGGNLAVNNGIYTTTIGAAGGGSALPATPVKYWHILLDGTTYSIPLYNP